MLQVQNLSKSYAARQVVSDVSFEAGSGQIIGLLDYRSGRIIWDLRRVTRGRR